MLAAYLRELEDQDLAAATRFFTGNPFAARDQRALSLGGSTIVTAARGAWKFSDAELARGYREHGDLGAALAPLIRPTDALELFNEPLHPAALKSIFDEIASASGKASGRKRQLLCERILSACRNELEAKYVIKIMTSELRIGLKEGLVIDALAKAFDRQSAEIRRAVMASGDIGTVAVAARGGRLEEIAVAYGSPIGFMLASPVVYGSSYRELRDGKWVLEDKFDGIRAQLHKDGDTVKIYSRTLNDVAHSYPEIVNDARLIPGSFIFDGEIIAEKDERVLPFRYLQARLQRKEISEELLQEVPVTFACFDLLAHNERFLLDEPLELRREALSSIAVGGDHLRLAAWSHWNDAAGADELHERFEAARARGNEGLMLKRVDSAYHPGRRGKWWLKLKRELSTLDVVVVAVEWGHGKRANVLSDYTFAVRGDGGQLLTIGKAYSGLTDAEIARLTEWFLAHTLSDRSSSKRSRYAMPVQPRVVLEVAFDIIQESDLHESGFALRFPRIVRIRDDKPPEQIDTLQTVREIYSAMLRREGLSAPASA
ncbi:MAG: ATP-dependent DNA ligase [Candidatus Eremiobacteraeota bacterium]|nr:ATP-dependent DNA ligase [Candidatus Eremiobacteraeota bacterium]